LPSLAPTTTTVASRGCPLSQYGQELGEEGEGLCCHRLCVCTSAGSLPFDADDGLDDLFRPDARSFHMMWPGTGHKSRSSACRLFSARGIPAGKTGLGRPARRAARALILGTYQLVGDRLRQAGAGQGVTPRRAPNARWVARQRAK